MAAPDDQIFRRSRKSSSSPDGESRLYRNGEHYPDPTAGKAIKSAEPKMLDPEVERASDMVRRIKALLAEEGYRLIERVKFEDIYTGREWT